jgi:hypothetical protein
LLIDLLASADRLFLLQASFTDLDFKDILAVGSNGGSSGGSGSSQSPAADGAGSKTGTTPAWLDTDASAQRKQAEELARFMGLRTSLDFDSIVAFAVSE